MREPSVLVPYPGPVSHADYRDIVLYLRPESNGVRVESTIVRAIREHDSASGNVHLVYLANLPGEFLVSQRVIEEHYATRIRFAREGKALFTPTMRHRFEAYFGLSFDSAPVVGAFAALQELGIEPEELFRIRVAPADYTLILGQSVKLHRGLFVINYDIPAILAKYHEGVDVFAMMLRSRLSYEDFSHLIHRAGEMLVQEQIVPPDEAMSRVFHYSKGPFEEILDGIGYIYEQRARHVPYGEMSFFRYLLDKGCKEERILEVVRNPIVMTTGTPTGETEVNLFDFTRGNSYPEALDRYRRISGPYMPT